MFCIKIRASPTSMFSLSANKLTSSRSKSLMSPRNTVSKLLAQIVYKIYSSPKPERTVVMERYIY